MRKNHSDWPGQVQIDTSIQACVVTTASRRPPSLAALRFSLPLLTRVSPTTMPLI